MLLWRLFFLQVCKLSLVCMCIRSISHLSHCLCCCQVSGRCCCCSLTSASTQPCVDAVSQHVLCRVCRGDNLLCSSCLSANWLPLQIADRPTQCPAGAQKQPIQAQRTWWKLLPSKARSAKMGLFSISSKDCAHCTIRFRLFKLHVPSCTQQMNTSLH